MKEAQSLQNPIATQILIEELLQLHRGQGMDIYWRESVICPTEAEYLEMVCNKTGGLFRLCVKVMQAESNNISTPDCVPLADVLRVIFQIRDDYLNLQSDDFTPKKGLCEDLAEGKFSFPIIHGILNSQEKLQLLEILQQKSTNSNLRQRAVELMVNAGSFEYTRKTLSTLIRRSRDLVDTLEHEEGANHKIRNFLDRLMV